MAIGEYYSALEEARADLVGLYFIADPKLVELQLVSAADQAEIVQAEYESYTRNALLQLRRIRQGTQIEEDHMRNRQLIVHWLMANTKAIEKRTRDGKTYYVMVDAAGVPCRALAGCWPKSSASSQKAIARAPGNCSTSMASTSIRTARRNRPAYRCAAVAVIHRHSCSRGSRR